MEEPGQHPCVRVRRKDFRVVSENKEKIRQLFSVRLRRKTSPPSHQRQQHSHDVSKSTFVYLAVEPETSGTAVPHTDLTSRVQMFVDSLCGGSSSTGGRTNTADAAEAAAGDDSSYDSDYEDKEETGSGAEHVDVSRTVSDTLGAEFDEYVSRSGNVPPVSIAQQQQDYTARVEFGLKLGYTERLVQVALQKLGPAPGQNELLEELIRLGARSAAGGGEGGGGGGSVGPGAEDPDAPDALAAAAADYDETAPAPPALPLALPNTASTPAAVHLRHIVVDGSNVAMSHGNKEVFSCRGIRICVDWFLARGHREITVFVPKWRKEASRPDNPIIDQEILMELERERLLVFTPSRLVGGKRMVCYDDRYVLRLAAETDGVVVSNDNYRDLAQESPEFRKVVEERILMYSFVNDRFMPPDDPLGRSGPTLDHFLRCSGSMSSSVCSGAGGGVATTGVGSLPGCTGASSGLPGQPRRPGEPPPRCPYGKKCTYGNKCKYQHPERGPLPHKSVTERLAEHAKQQLQARGRDAAAAHAAAGNPATKSVSLPLPGCGDGDKGPRKTPLARTRSSVPAPPTTTVSTPSDDQHPAGVPKSRSVENIQGGAYASAGGILGGVLPSTGYGLWGRPETAAGPWCTGPSPQPHQLVFESGHVAVAQRLSDPENAVPESTNLHRKLQRQLTLNPACDPRLQQLRGGAAHRPPGSPGAAAVGAGQLGSAWEAAHTRPPPPHPQHQHVTRNASAPDSYRSGPNAWNAPPGSNTNAASAAAGRNMFRHGSTSDPQINLCVEPSGDPFDGTAAGAWAVPRAPPVVWGPLPPPQSTEEQRRVLHYHLAALFPPEQVQQAMRMFPEETSAQKICAAILAMYPGKP